MTTTNLYIRQKHICKYKQVYLYKYKEQDCYSTPTNDWCDIDQLPMLKPIPSTWIGVIYMEKFNYLCNIIYSLYL